VGVRHPPVRAADRDPAILGRRGKPVAFGCVDSGREPEHGEYPGGDHERLVGAGERAAEGLDRFAVGVGGARPTTVHASTWT
jgi:hypothetical protein